jgi:prephenate dehydrogenase
MNKTHADIGTLCQKTVSEEAIFNPNVVKLVKSTTGKALYFSRSTIPFVRGENEKLWKEIIYSNRKILSGLLKNLNEDVDRMIQSLEDPSKIEKILAAGRSGRDLIPGKHGGKAREYSYLPIVIDDKPGQLAAIFNQCSLLDVNVEDLNIEHSPGQLNALITLALSARDAQKLSDHLASIGWNVHPIRN